MEDNRANISNVIKAGTRKSELALVQTNFVIKELKKHYGDKMFEIVPMTTKGDQILDKPLAEIGEKSLFTKEIEIALMKGEVDFIVHSLKDLPTSLPDGLVIGAVCKREDPSDVVIMHPDYKDKTLATLPEGSVIGTSSLRRVSQIKKKYSHLRFDCIRGNLNTRFKKLDYDDKYAALILAAAGVIRLGWEKRIGSILSSDECMHAVGQGALAIELRADDSKTLGLISVLNDRETMLSCIAERSFMKKLEGGCSVPVAVASKCTDDNKVVLTGGVFSLDGQESIVETYPSADHESENKNESATNSPIKKKLKSQRHSYCGIVSMDSDDDDPMLKAQFVGEQLAEILLKKGAGEILDKIRNMKTDLKNGLEQKSN